MITVQSDIHEAIVSAWVVHKSERVPIARCSNYRVVAMGLAVATESHTKMQDIPHQDC